MIPKAYVVKARLKRALASLRYFQQCQTPRRPRRLLGGTDVKIVRYPDRFTDSRGTELWETVLQLLAERSERQEAAAKEAG